MNGCTFSHVVFESFFLFFMQLLLALSNKTPLSYNKALDVWSYGCFLYWLLTGGKDLFASDEAAKAMWNDPAFEYVF